MLSVYTYISLCVGVFFFMVLLCSCYIHIYFVDYCDLFVFMEYVGISARFYCVYCLIDTIYLSYSE